MPPPPAAVLDAHLVDQDDCDRLQKEYQDYFLDLFWKVYYYGHPAIDEQKFRRLYNSLWQADGSRREPHPLVDIVFALNIQYAYAFIPKDDGFPGFVQEQGSVAGSPFYHRAQAAMQPMMETPSLMTVQCLFFTALYLSFARCYNAAYAAVKMAEQTASTICVEHDPGESDLLLRSRQCIRILDIKLSIKLGRPMPRGPSLENEPSDEEPEWLRYQRQLLRLSETASNVHTCFMESCGHLLEASGETSIYADPDLRERAAVIMKQQMHNFDKWIVQVPDVLRLRRVEPGALFTLSPSCLALEEDVPQWLQRQRIALTCHYHDYCASLLRIFINLSSVPERDDAPIAQEYCELSVNHAIAITFIISQVTRETDILTGCYQAFWWQQNATLTLAGFVTAYPNHELMPTARKALAAAREVFGTPCAGGLAAVRMESLIREIEHNVMGSIESLNSIGLQS